MLNPKIPENELSRYRSDALGGFEIPVYEEKLSESDGGFPNISVLISMDQTNATQRIYHDKAGVFVFSRKEPEKNRIVYYFANKPLDDVDQTFLLRRGTYNVHVFLDDREIKTATLAVDVNPARPDWKRYREANETSGPFVDYLWWH